MVPGTRIFQLFVVFRNSGKRASFLLEDHGVHTVQPAEITPVIDDVVSLRIPLPEGGK